MRIPRLSSSAPDSPCCLFCSQKVSSEDRAGYETHLVERHSLERRVQQTVTQTFQIKAHRPDQDNWEGLDSFKSVKGVMESLEKLVNVKVFTKKDTDLEPYEDLQKFVDDTERDMKKKMNEQGKESVISKVHVKKEGRKEDQNRATPHSSKKKIFDIPCKSTTDGSSKPVKPVKQDATSRAVENADDKSGKDEDSAEDLRWTDLSQSGEKDGAGSPGQAQYQCLVCIANIPWNEESLVNHVRSHKLDLNKYTNLFGKAIRKQINKQLGKDVEADFVNSTVNVSPKSDFKTQTKTKIECLLCHKEFSTNFKLQRHKKNEHTKVKTDVKIENVEKIPTSEINFSTFNNDSAVRDVKKEVVGDKFHCNTCRFTSTSKGHLTKHVKQVHEKCEGLNCCNQTFANKWKLFVHLNERHKDNKDYFTKFGIFQSLEKYLIK